MDLEKCCPLPFQNRPMIFGRDLSSRECVSGVRRGHPRTCASLKINGPRGKGPADGEENDLFFQNKVGEKHEAGISLSFSLHSFLRETKRNETNSPDDWQKNQLRRHSTPFYRWTLVLTLSLSPFSSLFFFFFLFFNRSTFIPPRSFPRAQSKDSR